MKITKAGFKQSLRNCKRIEAKTKVDAIAKRYISKDYISFWKEFKELTLEAKC